MKKKIIQYKYYKGEKKNPFSPQENGFIWWEGEKLFSQSDKKDRSFYQRVLASYNKALTDNSVSGILADQSVQLEKRVLVFYLDLWHGKHFPYDSYDAIFKY